MRRLLPLLGLYFVAAIAAHAQRGDVRLSPAEPVSFSLPDSLRVQSAASIGDVTLAAWGSSARDDDGTYRGAIVAQLVRDGAAIGTPVVVTSDAARPSGRLAVVAIAERFVVAWNDVRSDAPGLYARSIATSGAAAAESRLGPIASTIDAAGVGANRVLLWSSAPASIYLRGFEADGTPRPALDSMAGPLSRIVRLDGILAEHSSSPAARACGSSAPTAVSIPARRSRCGLRSHGMSTMTDRCSHSTEPPCAVIPRSSIR